MYRVTRGMGYKCADCKRGFSIRKHTIYERSPVPLRKWFAAVWLATSHRKGIPSTQLARELGVTQKTAWHMLGRIREVMGEMAKRGGPVSGEVEADETSSVASSRTSTSGSASAKTSAAGHAASSRLPAHATAQAA